MSHHGKVSSTNPTGAVEVVHVQSAATTTAPVDGGSGSGGSAKPAFTEVAGQSGATGANLPVEDIELASNAVQRGKADLTRTAGAERRLDGFDGVGGGGGMEEKNDAVAAGTADLNVSDQQNGLAAQRVDGMQSVNGLPDQDPRS